MMPVGLVAFLCPRNFSIYGMWGTPFKTSHQCALIEDIARKFRKFGWQHCLDQGGVSRDFLKI